MSNNKTSIYGLYGYGLDTDTARHTTFPEERRNWRVYIEETLKEHITKETDRAIETIDANTDNRAVEINTNIDGSRTTIVNRIDTAETNIKDKVNTVNTYVAGTLTSKVNAIETHLGNQDTAISGIRSVVDKVWNKIQNWTF